ncbi:MAG TPA: PadR family transcriptional regulator [Steroidobacteraceae bacterium]|nr:PadR family transcriptional regulator [Steroidobacteraceae bacterium]
MSRRKVSNPLALAVLACLYERPMHPYEIASTLRERHKDDSIKLNYGSLYSVVESLKGHSLIVEQQTARQGNRPERTVYELTDAGRLELIDWLSELLCRPMKEFTRFEAGLSLLPVLPPQDVITLLEERCKRLEVELAQYRSLRKLTSTTQPVPRLFLIESEYRMALREAELNWTRGLIADIAAQSLEGMELWSRFHEELAKG